MLGVNRSPLITINNSSIFLEYSLVIAIIIMIYYALITSEILKAIKSSELNRRLINHTVGSNSLIRMCFLPT